MKSLALLLCTSLALAAPPFVVQNQQAAIGRPTSSDSASDSLPPLRVEDFLAIESSKAHSHAGKKGSFNSDPSAQVVADGGASDVVEHPPVYLDFSSFTILEILNASLHHHPSHPPHDHEHGQDDAEPAESIWPHLPWPNHPVTDPSQLPLHRLGWLVNRSSEAQQALSKDGITLLAPDDLALTPPHRRDPHHGHASGESDPHAGIGEGDHEVEEEQPVPHPFHSDELDFESDSSVVETNRSAIFSKIIGYVLKYHTLSTVETGHDLAPHSTIATTLLSGFNSTEPLRLHIDTTWALLPHPYPTLKFNYYSTKRGLTIKAKNGLIHLISAPLLPPLSPLNKLFLFPQLFSTLTSGVQKVDLAEALLPAPWHPRSSSEELWQGLIDELTEGKGPYTLFAPTNWAFNKLGPKILALLHSPFPLSKKILKAILSYHVVPNVSFYSDYLYNSSALAPFVTGTEFDVEVNASIDQLLRRDGRAHPTSDIPGTFRGRRTHHRAPEVDIVEISTEVEEEADAAESHVEKHLADMESAPLSSRTTEWEARVQSLRSVLKANPALRRVAHLPSDPILIPARPSPPSHPTILHPPPHRANITHYALPTALANATLYVDVVEFRMWAHGPVKSVVVVLPGPPGSKAAEEGEKFVGCSHGKKGPRPVKVWKKDVPARNGAVHIVTEVLRPPYHHAHRSFEGHNVDARTSQLLAELFV
ncbi:hypothetical protein RQP46_001366 [Phenoliferia psychrophenolica]